METYQSWGASQLRSELRKRNLASGSFCNYPGLSTLRKWLVMHDGGQYDGLRAEINEQQEAYRRHCQEQGAEPPDPEPDPAPNPPPGGFHNPFKAKDQAPEKPAGIPAPKEATIPAEPAGDVKSVPNGLFTHYASNVAVKSMIDGLLTALNSVTGESFSVEALLKREVVEVIKEVPKEMPPAWSLPNTNIEYVRPSYYEFVNHLIDIGFSVCLVGPSGCGKTTFWREVSAARRLKYIYNDCGIETTANDIIGGITLKDGSTAFQPGKLVQAMGYNPEQDEEEPGLTGALYRLGEMDFLNPGIAGRLHGVLDKMKDGRRRLDVPQVGKTFFSHPGMVFVGDANTTGRATSRNYTGTQRLNEAFINRFKTIRVDYENEGLILKGYGIDRATAKKMVRFAKDIRKQLDEKGIPFVYTTRDLTDAALMVKGGMTLQVALTLPFHKLERAENAKMGGNGDPLSLFTEEPAGS